MFVILGRTLEAEEEHADSYGRALVWTNAAVALRGFHVFTLLRRAMNLIYARSRLHSAIELLLKH